MKKYINVNDLCLPKDFPRKGELKRTLIQMPKADVVDRKEFLEKMRDIKDGSEKEFRECDLYDEESTGFWNGYFTAVKNIIELFERCDND